MVVGLPNGAFIHAGPDDLKTTYNRVSSVMKVDRHRPEGSRQNDREFSGSVTDINPTGFVFAAHIDRS